MAMLRLSSDVMSGSNTSGLCVMEGGGYVGRIVCDRCTHAASSCIAFNSHSREPKKFSVGTSPAQIAFCRAAMNGSSYRRA
jgi:hypothetical protein